MEDFIVFLVRYLHVLCGVMWIGILWYFNFVQIPSMPKIPDEQKPAISKVIAPEALFWFRWGAAGTVLFGLILAYMNDYLHQALTLQQPNIGFGMWMGLIMAFNVWFIIWPAQKIALGIVEADADAKPAAGRRAMLFSRTNTLLSIPMLFSMISAQNATGF
ncbi:MAG: urate hydroxylase PuuD [Emcibacter sp.]|nr:urate hydroxylase PuuD [Emcibacter sp.]